MTKEEITEFLTEMPRTAKIATVREDGRPHVAPIWFELDGDTFVFTTWHESIKAANMTRDGRISLCIDDEVPPFAYVIIEGEVSISEDPDELRHWATQIAGRYMGPNLAEAYGKRNSVKGELLVRVTPTYIMAQKNIAV
ncbi:MAG: PPOX class F420-dependent oxidoreductase [Anaerolineae bacterium]|nr:PPOX class F420-dependent oxidoreductase [Anaerolineae bacterium]